MQEIRALQLVDDTGLSPVVPPYWFEGVDFEAISDFRPRVTVPQRGDGTLSRFSRMIDIGSAQSMTTLILASSLSTAVRSIRDGRGLIEEWEYYADPKFLVDPDSFFVPPGDAFTPARREVRISTFVPPGGELWDLFFASPFEPHNPAVRRKYLRHDDNRVCSARYWAHNDGPRPTILLVHGYVASNMHLNTELFNARWLYERGLDVMLFELPFHGRRSRFVPGFMFLDFNLARMAEAIGHAVHDLRVLIGWLLRQGVPTVGMMGASLGGYMSALMTDIEPRLDFAVAMIPAVSFVDTMFDWPARSSVFAPLLNQLGVTVDDVRRYAAVHAPLQHAPLLPPERLFVIAADCDAIARPYQAQLLVDHWGGPHVHWYAGSHSVHVRRSTYLRALGRFLGGLGLFD